MRLTTLAFALVLTMILAGCSGGTRHRAATPPAAPSTTATATATSTSTTTTSPRGPVGPRPPLSARIVLTTRTVTAGSRTPARVVVENDTGHPVYASGCGQLFELALSNHEIRQEPARLTCLQRFTIPVGESSYPVQVDAIYLGCVTGPPQGFFLSCRPDGQLPPLPAGDYHVGLVGPGSLVPAPPSVSVHVVASRPAP